MPAVSIFAADDAARLVSIMGVEDDPPPPRAALLTAALPTPDFAAAAPALGFAAGFFATPSAAGLALVDFASPLSSDLLALAIAFPNPFQAPRVCTSRRDTPRQSHVRLRILSAGAAEESLGGARH